jgi:hypothetical protein
VKGIEMLNYAFENSLQSTSDLLTADIAAAS